MALREAFLRAHALQRCQEIKAAQKEATQLMRFGDPKAAIRTLERVRPWLCASSDVGGQVSLLLPLALTLARSLALPFACDPGIELP